jgi:DNA modification methylase
LEETPQEYVDKLRTVFSETRRVLADDGTCWVNLGDSYASSAKCSQTESRLKPKDLIGIPWMVAFALREEGWWLRQDIIWSKKNPMPESVKDRCTKSHEYLFLLTKSQKYYWNKDAIMERGSDPIKKSGKVSENNYCHKSGRNDGGYYRSGEGFGMTGFRNKRSVWEIGSQGSNISHFATMNKKLIAPCILAGCPENGVVLDMFNGSGTTGDVALSLNRKYIGIDINEEYINMSINRLKDVQKSYKIEPDNETFQLI